MTRPNRGDSSLSLSLSLFDREERVQPREREECKRGRDRKAPTLIDITR